MIFVIMFMIVEIKTDTMIVCPPTCYGATVGCAVFYLISNDPRFLTFVQRASIQNKRLALNVRDATDHWTNKQIPIRSNLIQGHKIILFDPNSLTFPNWLINSLHWSHHVMHVNASGCIEAVLLWFLQISYNHTINIERPESDLPVNWAIVWCGLSGRKSWQTSRHTVVQGLILNMFQKFTSPSWISKVMWIGDQILLLLNSMFSDIDCELFVCFSLGLKVQNLPREESAVSCRFLLRTEEIKCRCFNNHGFLCSSPERYIRRWRSILNQDFQNLWIRMADRKIITRPCLMSPYLSIKTHHSY